MEEIPVKAPKKPRVVEERTVFVIQDGAATAILKRPDKGLLAGLYELPNTLGYMEQEEAVSYVKNMGLEPLYIKPLPSAKHIFSHIEWRMKAYRVRVSSLENREKDGILFVEKRQKEKNYAIPSAFGAYVKYMKEDKA